jgi:hypothetical protein
MTGLLAVGSLAVASGARSRAPEKVEAEAKASNGNPYALWPRADRLIRQLLT